MIHALRAAFGTAPPEREDLWEKPDEWLKDQVTIKLGGRELRAVATPGHTQGHTVFADLGARTCCSPGTTYCRRSPRRSASRRSWANCRWVTTCVR